MAKKDENVIEVDQDSAVEILTAMGVKKAAKMSLKDLTKKLNAEFKDLYTENKDELDKDTKKWCKDALAAVKDGAKFSVTESEESEEEEEEEEEEAPKKGKKSKAKDDDDEEDDEKPAKKGKDKKKGKKSGGIKKEGKIDFIIECLEGASKSNPITKEKILKLMCKKFKDSEESAMKETIKCQVGYQLKAKKDLNVIRTDDGYYIGKSKK